MLIDTKTLTKELSISRTTLHSLEKRGVVRPLRIGRAVRWNQQQVLMDLQRTTAAAFADSESDSESNQQLQAA